MFSVGWCVYILICEDSSYYVGLSNDLSQRLHDHAHGKGPTYTKQTHSKIFVWYESHPNRLSAHSREQQLKGWTRVKKDKLTKGVSQYNFGHPIWLQLSEFKSPPKP